MPADCPGFVFVIFSISDFAKEENFLLTLTHRQLLHSFWEGLQMEYSIRELSQLSGVTTRTLRWYDQIGLLKPGRVAQNGYRYYGRAQVDRLQDILYYRALGVELARIRECLDDPSFD